MTTDSSQTPGIATRLDTDDLALPGLAGTPDHLPAQAAAVIRIPIKVAMQTEEGIRKRAQVTPGMKGYSVFELRSDEGTSMPPGTDSAPAPLDYFAAGAAFCLASHLTLLISQKKLHVRGFRSENELWFGYTAAGRGICLGLRSLIDIDSDEPAEQLRGLVEEAKGLCLAEAALAAPVPIQTILNVNGTPVATDLQPRPGSLHPPADADRFIQ